MTAALMAALPLAAFFYLCWAVNRAEDRRTNRTLREEGYDE